MPISEVLNVIDDGPGEPEGEKMEEKEEERIVKQNHKDCKDEENIKEKEDGRKIEKEEKSIKKEEDVRRNEEQMKIRGDAGRRVENGEKMTGEEQTERKKIEEETRKGEEGRNLGNRMEINDTAVSPTAENETPLSSDRNRPGERERDLIPEDSYLSQSQRDPSPLSESRSNISSVRNEKQIPVIQRCQSIIRIRREKLVDRWI